jgi:phenylacetate-CoA ligase
MVFSLARYWLSLNYWNNASLASIKKMQLKKFRNIFEYAKQNSKFYREYYSDHGVLDLKVESFDDINKVPIINKAILQQYSTRSIMTCDMDNGINVHSTSGSTGEPIEIAFSKFEDYTAHIRVFWALKKAGYRITDKIVMITRYNEKYKFEIENDISIIGTIQRKLKLFQREIISIYEAVDEIIAKLMKTKARILWSTPSIMQIVVNRLKEKEIKFNFPIIFFTSENITWMQKELFTDYLGKNLNDLYGSMESPSLGIDFGLMGRFVILPNSNLFQFGNIRINKNSEKIGNVIITNLLNTTMPIIRYALNDLAEIDEQPNFGVKYINKIVGRQDDILKLNNGKELAHHHAHEMFMDFHECQMFKFVQKTDKTILLQLKIANDQDRSHVQKLAHERWIKRFGEVPLLIEFVDDFKIDPQTGKFKNIEIE